MASERDDPLLVALAEHADDARIEIDRGARQPDGLGDAEACAVHQLDECPVAHRSRGRADRRVDQPLRLGRRQRARERADTSRHDDLRGGIVGSRPEQQLVPEVRADGGDAAPDRRSRASLGPHARDPLLELVGAGGGDGAPAEGAERGEVAAVGVDGALGAAGSQQEQVALDVGVANRHGGGTRFGALPAAPASRGTRVRVTALGPVGTGVAPVVHAAEAARVDVAVDLGRRQRRVSEQLLNRPEVGPALEQVGRVGVPEPVRVAQQPAQHRRVEPMSADREEQRVVRASGERRAAVPQVQGDQVCRFLAERDDALLPSLAEDVNRLLLEVDVSETEPDDLRAPEPARVRQLEHRTVAQCQRAVAVDRVDGRLDLGQLRRIRQPPDRRGARAASGTCAGPRVNLMYDRTAASRRAIVAGARPRRPRPSSAVYSASARTSTASSGSSLLRAQSSKSRRSEA